VPKKASDPFSYAIFGTFALSRDNTNLDDEEFYAVGGLRGTCQWVLAQVTVILSSRLRRSNWLHCLPPWALGAGYMLSLKSHLSLEGVVKMRFLLSGRKSPCESKTASRAAVKLPLSARRQRILKLNPTPPSTRSRSHPIFRQTINASTPRELQHSGSATITGPLVRRLSSIM